MSDSEPLSNSQFREWLGTNYSPSNGQVVQIKEFLERPLDELAALDTEVLQAQRILDALLTRQTSLKAHIDAHQALTHPIRRIPKELLQEIFLHCLPSTHLPVMASAEAPMLLTRICQPWRTLALSTPTLWSSIHVPIPRGRSENEHFEATDRRLACVKWWLALAKETRLAVSLFWPSTLRYAYGTERRFPSTILSHSLHIRMLELDLPDIIFAIFAETPPSELPHLERVVLRLPVPPGHPPRGVGVTGAEFWRAPKLTKIVWEGVDDEFLRLPLKWDNMQEIEVCGGAMIPMSYFSPTDALALVEVTPNLIKLTIELTHYLDSRVPPGFGPPKDVQSEEEPVPLRRAPIVLAHLTTLDLTDIYIDTDTKPMFLENLQLPALRWLKYCLIGLSVNTPSLSTHPLICFLRMQHDPVLITHLRVGATSVSRDTFIEVLRLLPLVKQVYLEDSRPLWSRQDSGDWRGDVEVAPDDELLRSFLPAYMWGRERWSDEQTRYPKIKYTSGGWRGQPRARTALGETPETNAGDGNADDGDGDDEDEDGDVAMTVLDDNNEDDVIIAADTPLPASPSTPNQYPPTPYPPSPAPPLRVLVSIPVDTSELAAEESECLCPHLESLRIDRARFTLKGLRTFVKARLKLSTNGGPILDNDESDSEHASGASSPTSKSAFVSAPSSPLSAAHNSTLLHHHHHHHTPLPAAIVPPVAPFERIHVGLMSARPALETEDGRGDLESELGKLGVRATVKFMEVHVVRNSYPGGRLRNDAREGVIGSAEGEAGWGW